MCVDIEGRRVLGRHFEVRVARDNIYEEEASANSARIRRRKEWSPAFGFSLSTGQGCHESSRSCRSVFLGRDERMALSNQQTRSAEECGCYWLEESGVTRNGWSIPHEVWCCEVSQPIRGRSLPPSASSRGWRLLAEIGPVLGLQSLSERHPVNHSSQHPLGVHQERPYTIIADCRQPTKPTKPSGGG